MGRVEDRSTNAVDLLFFLTFGGNEANSCSVPGDTVSGSHRHEQYQTNVSPIRPLLPSANDTLGTSSESSAQMTR